MDFMLAPPDSSLRDKINFKDSLLFLGSCFTEHIGGLLRELKFNICQNPHGILFDPASVASCIVSTIQKREYVPDNLFYFNELWQSWQHHSVFSNTRQDLCLETINSFSAKAHTFLQRAEWLVITLGTAFSYRLSEDLPVEFRNKTEGPAGEVANCHRAPAQWFDKHLMQIDEINSVLDNCIHRLFQFNPKIRIIFTVSPVRHIRDGIVENNRSKARLIEVVHNICNKFDGIYYFPAYELVIDVLRDYRFYDIDMVHPNYLATNYVLDQFMKGYIDEESRALMDELRKIVIARKHRPSQPDTQAHRLFLKSQFEKLSALQKKYPSLDLGEELSYFSLAE